MGDWNTGNFSNGKHNSFGSIMPGREYTAQSIAGYRFGFNTQEKDDEIYGKGNANSAMFWEYDSRVGRRWNIDPIIKIFLSGYSALRNNPNLFIDPEGNDDVTFNKDGSVNKIQKRSRVFELFKGNRGYVLGDDKKVLKFKFNDYKTDKNLFLDEKGNISGSKVKFDNSYDENKTSNVVDNGVEEVKDLGKNVFATSPKALERELNGLISVITSSKSGTMDYIKSENLDDRTIFIKNGRGFNDKDFGNFLWGMTMNRLGYTLTISKIGAQFNNLKSGNSDNGDQVGYVKASWKKPWKYFDSPADQRAIRFGWNNGGYKTDITSSILAATGREIPVLIIK